MNRITLYLLLTLSFLFYNCDICSNESVEETTECTNPIDCIEWCDVPGGEYIGGEENISLTIDYDYQIMKNEITNEQYIYFLNQAYEEGLITVWYDMVHGYYKGDEIYPEDSTYTYTITNEFDSQFPLTFEGGVFTVDSLLLDHPVDYLSWYGAIAFADFYNLSLPSSEEWEKAALGQTGWRFPWGNNEDLDMANIWDSGDPFDNGTTPIGFYNGDINLGYQTKDDSSPYGLHDLIGNVSEWTRSLNSENNHYIFKGMCWGANWYPDCWMNISDNSHFNIGLGIGFRCVR